MLFGNTFPMSLPFTRAFTVEPITVDKAAQLLCDSNDVRSFWGHAETLPVVAHILGIPVEALKPHTERPSLVINQAGCPVIEGNEGHGTSSWDVVVVSPTYRKGFRPAPGTVPGEGDIIGWNCLLIHFV